MKLGFIGVGKIATSVVEGIFKAKINIKEIILSPKNKNNARILKKKFSRIEIAKSNQEVLDKSNWIVLSVTPKVGKQILEKLKNDKLQLNLLAKDKELVTNSLQVVKKNKILNGIMQRLKDIDTSAFDETNKFQFEKLRKSILKEVNSDKSWKDLEKHIKNVHFEFLKRLKEKHPTISPRELDLSTYLLMNMSTKEISEIMNISGGGVELARYRLRKKLDLEKKESLTGYLMRI